MRGELALVGLVLLAIGTVLLAPVAGSSGRPRLATVLMGIAAVAGTASFVLALVATVRAGRRPLRPPADEEEP